MGPRLRDDLADLEPYDPDMRAVETMLSANENGYGLPGDVREELARRLAAVPLHRYPDATCRGLRASLAAVWGVRDQNVVVGNGGDELIFNTLLAFGGPGRTMVDCAPTFSAYALYARLTGTGVRTVWRMPDFSLDEDGVLEAASRSDVVFVASPNNPSGNLADPSFIRRLAEESGALVVVDEAYGEFADPQASCVALVGVLDNLCVLKTMSKAYALAGARVGYAVASERVVDALLAVRQPYSVSRLDQVAAQTVLDMRESLAPSCRALVRERGALAERLSLLASLLAERFGAAVLAVYPSEANFVLVRFDESVAGMPLARDVHERLARECSVLVRDFSRTPGLEGCLRITVGTVDENRRLMDALYRVLGCTRTRDGGGWC